MKILISLVLFGLQFIYVNGQTPPGQPEITAPGTIILGTTYSLSCSSTGGSPPTTVSFLKDNTVISTTTNSLNTATTTDTYTFTAAMADHFELFECQVDNNVLQNPLSTTIFVTVNFAPKPPTITGPNTLTQGDQGTWTCLSTDGYPAPTMTVRIGNTQFTTGFTTTSVLTNQAYTVNGTLIWSPTTANNGQLLCCVVSHSVLSTPQTACLTLTVNYVPTVSLTTNIFTVDYGNEVILGCTVSAHPTHTSVYWQKIVPGGNPITINLSNTNKYGGSSPNNPSLTIKNTDTNDQGKYVCFAANSVGTGQSSEGRLDVIGTEPVVTIPQTSYTINIGNSITIGCTINSNPAHTNVYWTKKIGTNPEQTITTGGSPTKYGGSTPQSPALIIYNVEESDAAQYNCYATNLVGTGSTSTPTTLNVIGNPPQSVAITPSPITVTEGNTITATCTATGNPNPTFEWTKSGSNTVIATGSVLQILNAQESHRGDYICKASNSFGSNTAQVNVNVQFIPKVTITDPAVEGKRGASAIIPCEFNSNPFATQVQWTKFASGTTVILDVDGNKYQGAILSNPSLTIYDLDSNDAASYRCEVTNSVGTGKSEYGTLTVDLTSEEESNNMEYIIAGVVTAVVVIVAFVIVSVVCYRRGQNSGNNNIRKNESNTFHLQQRGGMLQYANSDVSRMNSQHRHYYGLEPGTTDYHPYNPTPSSRETSQYITPLNNENEHYMTLPGDSTTPYYSEAMY